MCQAPWELRRGHCWRSWPRHSRSWFLPDSLGTLLRPSQRRQWQARHPGQWCSLRRDLQRVREDYLQWIVWMSVTVSFLFQSALLHLEDRLQTSFPVQVAPLCLFNNSGDVCSIAPRKHLWKICLQFLDCREREKESDVCKSVIIGSYVIFWLQKQL